jgi:secondary thiamine-phosphate synthase enzyme
MIQQVEIILPPYNRGFHLVTDSIIKQLPGLPDKGLLHIFIQHTSAGITINENYDPTVRKDFETFFNKLIPDGSPYFVHDSEGDDDMPAHLKASIIGQSVTIPITDKRLNLGTWQGIYLCEFRNNGGRRKLLLTVYS